MQPLSLLSGMALTIPNIRITVRLSLSIYT